MKTLDLTELTIEQLEALLEAIRTATK